MGYDYDKSWKQVRDEMEQASKIDEIVTNVILASMAGCALLLMWAVW